MQLMVCSSVFQLYTALAIKQQFLKDEKVDLLLTDATPMFKDLKTNPALLKIFNNVFHALDIQKSSKFNRVVRSKYYRRLFDLFPRHYLNKILKKKWESYTDVYLSSFNTITIRLQSYLLNKNKNLRTHLFEDGISTYLIKSKYKWEISETTKRLLKIKNIEDRFCDAFLFEPSLVCVDYGFPLIKIPRPTEIEGFTELFDQIIGNENKQLTEKFIFFEESFNNDGLVTNDAALIDLVWETLEKKDFILKHHPRNSIDRFKECLPTVDFFMFWEHYFLKNDINHNVIITVSSNTAFVPYILAKAKSTVVLLYKLFNGTSPILGCGKFEEYVEKYLKYTKSKVYIPETVEELKDVLNSLRSKKL